MELFEQYDWLVRNGIIKEPDPNTTSVYDYQQYRFFIDALKTHSPNGRVSEILSKISCIKSDLDDVEYELENLSEE